jgi:hypothetical protein
LKQDAPASLNLLLHVQQKVEGLADVTDEPACPAPRMLLLFFAWVLGWMFLGGTTVHGASPLAGTYIGPVYFSTEGEYSLPEQVVGQNLITIDADGQLTDLGGDLTGTVDEAGTITFGQPNPFFLSTGSISGTVLSATGSAEQGQVMVTTRISANSGAGEASASLAGKIEQVNPMASLTRMERGGSAREQPSVDRVWTWTDCVGGRGGMDCDQHRRCLPGSPPEAGSPPLE